MSSKLLFTQSSPLDTAVVYGPGGNPLYEIETEVNTVQKITVVRKLDLSTSELASSLTGGLRLIIFVPFGQIVAKKTFLT